MRFAARVALITLVAAWAPVTRAQVSASLVAADASIQPGHSFTVALRLVHDPGWHTYWINPGTGVATTLQWRLPAGLEAGAIQWPAPRLMRDATGAVTGHGYDGDLLLPVAIAPPVALRPGERVKLSASANWLMCADYCIPGHADVELSLPVSGASPRPDIVWADRIVGAIQALPRTFPEWVVSATVQGQTIDLLVRAASVANSGGPGELHFFPEDNYIGYDLPQSVASDGKGGYVLTLRTSADAPATPPAKLLGVLTAKDDWDRRGAQHALRIETPLIQAASSGRPSRSGVPATTQSADPDPSAGTSAQRTVPADTGLLLTLALAFAGGLILNLMPCVFPVLGIKVLGFVEHSRARRREVLMHGLSYSAGVVLSFWALAGVLAVLRSGGGQLGWGFQLQAPRFVFLLTAVMLVFGLNLSGVFEIGLRATTIGSGLLARTGARGAFFAGALATVVATPCSAPFLAPALGAALTLPTAQSLLVFSAIAVGLSAPYLLLSLCPAAVRLLPRPGEWMVTFKQLMAFPLYATAAWLVWVLAGQISENELLAALLGLTLIAMAAWMYGRCNVPGSSNTRLAVGLVGTCLLLVFGGAGGLPRSPTGSAVSWEKWSPETVESLRAHGRPVYVDFTARWCATCQANKRLVFNSQRVLRAFSDRKVALLKADWTNQDPQITAALAHLGRSAVPVNLLYLPGASEPVLLPTLLTPDIVLHALQP